MILFQIIVSSFLPNETHLKLDSEFLTKDTDSHAILGGHNETILQRPEVKQDITYKEEGYLRGKWVTITALNDKTPFELAEIRVYGSKCLLLLIQHECYGITFHRESF